MNGSIAVPGQPRQEYEVQQATDREPVLDVLKLTAIAVIALVNLILVTWPALAGRQIASQVGEACLDILMVLTGYVLARCYKRQNDAGIPWKHFIQSRIIRILPVYVVGIIIGGITWVTLYSAGNKVAPLPAAGFISALIPIWPDPIQGALNSPAWTINLAVIGVISMPWIIHLNQRFKARAALLIGSVAVVLSALLNLLGINITILVGLAPIALGAYFGLTRLPINKQKAWMLIAAGAAILVLSGFLRLISGEISYAMRIVAMNGAALTILGVTGYPLRHTLARKSLAHFSYPLYMVHFPAISMCVAVGRHVNADTTGIVLFAIAFAGLSAMALIPLDQWSVRKSRAFSKEKAAECGKKMSESRFDLMMP